MEKDRRRLIGILTGLVVTTLIGVGASRNGRVLSLLRNLKHRTSSIASNTSSSGSDSGWGDSDRTQRFEEELPEVKEYREFLNSLGLRYFSASEIIRPHRNYRNGVQNNIPPKRLWEDLVETLQIADELRHRLGVSVTILSAYRSPDYNSAIGGASRSQHMINRALDLSFDCSSDDAFAVAEKMRTEGFFTGGLGWYPSFIHVDTRGHEATWGRS